MKTMIVKSMLAALVIFTASCAQDKSSDVKSGDVKVSEDGKFAILTADLKEATGKPVKMKDFTFVSSKRFKRLEALKFFFHKQSYDKECSSSSGCDNRLLLPSESASSYKESVSKVSAKIPMEKLPLDVQSSLLAEKQRLNLDGNDPVQGVDLEIVFNFEISGVAALTESVISINGEGNLK